MRKKKVLLSSLMMFMSIGMAHADDVSKAYVSVQQNDAAVTAVGTAAFNLSSSPSVEFVNGKAVMTVNGNTVATLPMSDGGQLAVEFTGSESNVSKTLKNGYATLYSPFQLQVPTGSGVDVYAPTYDEPMLRMNNDTKVEQGAIIPAGTALVLKNNGTIAFTFSADAATDTHVSALSGSALKITKPVEEGKTVYTLGHEKTDPSRYGFFTYTGSYLNPGLAYLFVGTVTSNMAKYVSLDFGDATGIEEINNTESEMQSADGKYLESGRVVIVKNGMKYNINGQEVK